MLDRLCFHLIILLVVWGSVPAELGVRGWIDRLPSLILLSRLPPPMAPRRSEYPLKRWLEAQESCGSRHH
jgi:hypothetical protein